MKTLSSEVTMETNFPWIVFRLGDNQCAINSQRVISITALPDSVTIMPDAPPYVRGLLTLRGRPIPLIDLRILFGKRMLREEYQEFAEMLEARKKDHLCWAEELKKSIQNNTEIVLAVDPHKCIFGQWYDSYHDNRSTVSYPLAKIDAPHKRLHYAAELAKLAKEQTNSTERTKQLQQILDEVEQQVIPEIVGLLDEAAAFKDGLKEQVLIVGDDNHQVGCTVDEVLAVQKLSLLGGKEVYAHIADTNYLIGISKNEQGLILELDDGFLEAIGNQYHIKNEEA